MPRSSLYAQSSLSAQVISLYPGHLCPGHLPMPRSPLSAQVISLCPGHISLPRSSLYAQVISMPRPSLYAQVRSSLDAQIISLCPGPAKLDTTPPSAALSLRPHGHSATSLTCTSDPACSRCPHAPFWKNISNHFLRVAFCDSFALV